MRVLDEISVLSTDVVSPEFSSWYYVLIAW